MKAKRIAASLVAAGVALGPVQSSAGDALAGGLVGAVIGGLIVNEMHKNKSRPQASTVRRSTANTGQREANREVQTALNYFGYNVGTPDGAIGPKTRTGVSQFQALMGYPPTGQLTDFERTILVTAYQRAIVGGPATMQVAANHPQGTRGLLLMQRDQMAGLPVTGFGMGQGTMAAAPMAPAMAPQAPTVPAFGATPEPAAPVAPAAPALPNFFGGGGAVMASLASHCNKVSLLTNTNGGFVTAASMTDPVFALSEQFCLARTYAMAQAEELVAKMPGATPQQVAEQCAGLGPALEDHVTALSIQDRDTVMQGVSGFVLSSGMAPAQLSATAKICLGSGYTTDNMDVAVGSALLLTVLGEKGYAELLGHHLAQGFGASQRTDLALPWYETSLESAPGGATMVFAPGMPDRAALIRKAAFTLGGKGDKAALEPPVAPAVPVFAVPTEPAGGAIPVVSTAQDTASAPPARTGVAALPLAARLPFMVFGQ
ncbi:Putative peptidoglycan binding domain-containing protein [Gemmobacter megaterium]|uniref:Putative peptidoglycan binding domain-containing protein n=1 Tax=Gemmobacter megaterium TaxID=1086013 RepID=A0A1N7QMK1_9RHOB|nr:peptidoglycan-binding domain-containing protein [Gemmobacter megaterium]SIT24053.1 Putative peptidoglycan binding domain-containing protein [Gemmobacter megaterium]